MDSQYYTTLVLLSMISFGTHFCHSSLSIFGAFFIQDNFVSAFGLSALFAANFLTSVVIPLCTGYLIDKTQHLKLITASLLITALLGQIAFVDAICRNDFWMAITAQVLFGSGASSVSAVQRISISLYLKEHLSFSTGFYVAVAGVSKLLGKVTVGPIAYDLKSYQETMLLPVLLCALSLFCYVVFLIRDGSTPPNMLSSDNDSHRSDRSLLDDSITQVGSDKLNGRFYLLAALHTIYILVFHLLQGFTPHLATILWHDSIVDAGYIAGITPLMVRIVETAEMMDPTVYQTIFIAPFVGALTNRYNNIMIASVGAAVLVVIGYSVLLFASVDPMLPILLIALAQAALSTLILATIAAHLANSRATGFAFGVIEALDGVANVVGNLMFGYLFSVTSSYFAGLFCLLVLACIGLGIIVYLYIGERTLIRQCNADNEKSGVTVNRECGSGEMQRLISSNGSSRESNGSYGMV